MHNKKSYTLQCWVFLKNIAVGLMNLTRITFASMADLAAASKKKKILKNHFTVALPTKLKNQKASIDSKV